MTLLAILLPLSIVIMSEVQSYQANRRERRLQEKLDKIIELLSRVE